MSRPSIAHFYHCFADGNWQTPVTDHFEALTRYGLADVLTSVHVGYVGSPENIAAAHCTVEHYVPGYTRCAEAPTGFEQETLEPMWKWVQDHDGLVSYAHTKGASRNDPIDKPWRRAMEYHNFVDWRRPLVALLFGKSIAGCHWHRGGPSSIEGYGTGGMFGGNYFWTHAELLRQNVPPGRESRFAAEHWLGQLSEVMPITAETIEDLHPGMIHDLGSVPAW